MAFSRVVVAVLTGLGLAGAWKLRRYEIAEESMAPALAPGDYVVAVRKPARVRPGDVVIFDHPDREGFTLVKRVVSADEAALAVRGDNRAESADVGPVPHGAVEARVLGIYWPPGRCGRVSS